MNHEPVTLPNDLETKTIAMMFPGETLYTVPWAMLVDIDRRCWLRGDYRVSDQRANTSTMEIHRNSRGFDVRLHVDFTFQLQPLTEWEHETWNLQPVTNLEKAHV